MGTTLHFKLDLYLSCGLSATRNTKIYADAYIFFDVSTYFYHLAVVCISVSLFYMKKCVRCFIPVGTHSRFTESVQAMQKLHFCNFRV